jgi:hypothetical protein
MTSQLRERERERERKRENMREFVFTLCLFVLLLPSTN